MDHNYQIDSNKVFTSREKELLSIIAKQMDINAHLNMLFHGIEDSFHVDPLFLRHFLSFKQSDESFESLLDETVRLALERFYAVNQFIHLQEADIEDLKSIYRETVSGVNGEHRSAVLRNHHRALSKWIQRYYSDSFIQALGGQETIGRLVNRDYSVDLHRELFSLDAGELMEPVLDIGCGRSDNMVRYLKELGKSVLGIDRILDHTAVEEMQEISWFDFPFHQKQWGSIIAHMSFTNHLLHARESGDLFYLYVHTYKAIIDSLKPGGCFYCAPSVGIIEDRIDGRGYKVSRRAVHGVWISTIERC